MRSKNFWSLPSKLIDFEVLLNSAGSEMLYDPVLVVFRSVVMGERNEAVMHMALIISICRLASLTASLWKFKAYSAL